MIYNVTYYPCYRNEEGQLREKQFSAMFEAANNEQAMLAACRYTVANFRGAVEWDDNLLYVGAVKCWRIYVGEIDRSGMCLTKTGIDIMEWKCDFPPGWARVSDGRLSDELVVYINAIKNLKHQPATAGPGTLGPLRG